MLPPTGATLTFDKAAGTAGRQGLVLLKVAGDTGAVTLSKNYDALSAGSRISAGFLWVTFDSVFLAGRFTGSQTMTIDICSFVNPTSNTRPFVAKVKSPAVASLSSCTQI